MASEGRPDGRRTMGRHTEYERVDDGPGGLRSARHPRRVRRLPCACAVRWSGRSCHSRSSCKSDISTCETATWEPRHCSQVKRDDTESRAAPAFLPRNRTPRSDPRVSCADACRWVSGVVHRHLRKGVALVLGRGLRGSLGLCLFAAGLTVAWFVNASLAEGKPDSPAASVATITVTLGHPSEFELKLSKALVPAGTVIFKVTNSGKSPHYFKSRARASGSRSANACVGQATPTLDAGQVRNAPRRLQVEREPTSSSRASPERRSLE